MECDEGRSHGRQTQESEGCWQFGYDSLLKQGGGDGDSRLQINDHVSEEQSSGEQRPTNKQKEVGVGGILRVGLNITNAYQRRNGYQLAFIDFSASMRLKL